VVAQTSAGRMLNAAHHMAKDVIRAGRADLYLSISTDPSTDEMPMLIWHDPDKALTANLSMAPDLQLPMRGMVGRAASGQGDGFAGIVASNQVQDDPRYDKEIDNRSHWAHPTTMMCVPIVSASADKDAAGGLSNRFGVLQVVNKIDPGGFTDYDAQVAAQVSICCMSFIFEGILNSTNGVLLQASAFIGTCLESSRRQDRQAELMLAIARFAAVLTVDAVLRAMMSASSDWLVNRAKCLRVWVPRDPGSSALVLHASAGLGQDAAELGSPASPFRALPRTPAKAQASKSVVSCYSKREKIQTHTVPAG
jgi:hypothetical protein